MKLKKRPKPPQEPKLRNFLGQEKTMGQKKGSATPPKTGNRVTVNRLSKSKSAMNAKDLKQIRGGVDNQQPDAERWKILQDTQTKIFEIQQDVTVNKAKAQDKPMKS